MIDLKTLKVGDKVKFKTLDGWSCVDLDKEYSITEISCSSFFIIDDDYNRKEIRSSWFHEFELANPNLVETSLEFKPERMLVWDDGECENNAIERVVLFRFPSGKCRAVCNGEEELFKEGVCLNTVLWDNCKPLPVEKSEEEKAKEKAEELVESLSFDELKEKLIEALLKKD